MKKLMLLGGLRYLLPVIEAAHKRGLHVITVDYLPKNIAHQYSDEYHNVSIIDKDRVLKLAQELKIDGIMSFAVDPGVVTASYVAEKLSLPFQTSYESTCILQDKGKFRRFLTENNFNVPSSKSYKNIKEAVKDAEQFQWPVIVKPVDSAGSKGVSRVDVLEKLQSAIKYALDESYNKEFIIEEFLDPLGCPSDSDCFTVDGKLIYCSFSDQMFDVCAINPYTPAAFSWPSTMSSSAQDELERELQRLMSLLNVGTGIYNIETRLCKNGKPYIMEVSPRGGGNRLAEMLQYVTDVDLIENAVRAAVGESLTGLVYPVYKNYLAELILHSDKDGIFKSLHIDKEIEETYLVERDLWIQSEDPVNSFSSANMSLGTLVLKFDSREELNRVVACSGQWAKLIID